MLKQLELELPRGMPRDLIDTAAAAASSPTAPSGPAGCRQYTKTNACADQVRDVDYVLTALQLAAIIEAEGIDLFSLEASAVDDPLGLYGGAGALFGTTGATRCRTHMPRPP